MGLIIHAYVKTHVIFFNNVVVKPDFRFILNFIRPPLHKEEALLDMKMSR